MSRDPSPEEWAAWFAQPRHDLSQADLEAWLATDDVAVPDEARATCPTCDGWGNTRVGGPSCATCGGSGVVDVGTWRRELRARVAAGVS